MCVFVAETSLVGRVDELDTHRLATPRDIDDPAGPAAAGMLAAVFRRPACTRHQHTSLQAVGNCERSRVCRWRQRRRRLWGRGISLIRCVDDSLRPRAKRPP